MAVYTATIDWTLRDGDDFPKGRYSRAHTIAFDGGVTLPASSSPHVVPLPWSDPAGVDPEEMLVASLSNCHMLTFLDLARRDGFFIRRYHDAAEGVMSKLESGKWAVTRVTLKPAITFEGREPTPAEMDHLHHRAHEDCFIANSVKTEVVVEPQPARQGG
ncbi:MAG: peroxiredoxin [Caulobacter sp.]|nr:peroxiredoxin [Caulobacter sp.]